MEDHMAKFSPAVLAVALALGLTLAACQDTKTRTENEQLKAQVANLQNQINVMGDRVNEVTKAKDDLAKQNAALKAQVTWLKGHHHAAMIHAQSRRHHNRAA